MNEEIKAVRTVVIRNPQGVHARPADMFVKRAIQFQSTIEVIKDNERVDGKSILAILMLAAVVGTELRLEATGVDAEQALDSLAELVNQGFGEE
jgi:phosphotransferase system HPr (HPr) family protein